MFYVFPWSQSYCCTVLGGIYIDVELFLALIHTLQIDGDINSVDEIWHFLKYAPVDIEMQRRILNRQYGICMHVRLKKKDQRAKIKVTVLDGMKVLKMPAYGILSILQYVEILNFYPLLQIV